MPKNTALGLVWVFRTMFSTNRYLHGMISLTDGMFIPDKLFLSSLGGLVFKTISRYMISKHGFSMSHNASQLLVESRFSCTKNR